MRGRGGETGGGEILNNISQAVAPGKERRDISLVNIKGRKIALFQVLLFRVCFLEE